MCCYSTEDPDWYVLFESTDGVLIVQIRFCIYRSVCSVKGKFYACVTWRATRVSRDWYYIPERLEKLKTVWIVPENRKTLKRHFRSPSETVIILTSVCHDNISGKCRNPLIHRQ